MKIYQYLTYGGIIPFAFLSALNLLGCNRVYLLSVDDALKSYSLVISVFMSAIYWGIQLKNPQKNKKYFYLYSNFWTLLVWFAFLCAVVKVFYIIVVLSFLSYLYTDYKLYQSQEISKTYLQMRVITTSIVVPLLLLITFLGN
ncbi:hypothetical protein CF386_12570 [Paraphotobacterium marinum]|uniref:DUF3429 domain-containing protein n=1 Tax=Paraphotobacterium marinum TaxID=1755811 RepID=A0A220VIT8_9GAMM|nr:DUF3429 domain-containing protein [Paraphotobacterium marinum]ASK79863.1 hypothetical protein CF386_12570 [Paraphotobacterium marinum]